MTFLLAAKGRRTAAALGAVSAGLLVLSACGDKPTPMTTVTFGDNTVSSEATCYDDGDKGLDRVKAKECALKKSNKSIKVTTGETMRIGVDPSVSKTGWTLWVNGQEVFQGDPFKKTYRSFQNIDVFAAPQGETAPDKLYISVVETSAAKEGEPGKIKGVWNYKLVNEDA
ncbi:hypothetical protein [Streptomyces apocyni]|uniref:hypothetical protein n=1 Tax=Streptomyces apocyni TaxID=2654677 RepID=UPI0012E9F1B0|nr:hypothetical protein [Streptomyces apocyni]